MQCIYLYVFMYLCKCICVFVQCIYVDVFVYLSQCIKQATFMSSAIQINQTFCCSIYSTCRPVTSANPWLGGLRGTPTHPTQGSEVGKKVAKI